MQPEERDAALLWDILIACPLSHFSRTFPKSFEEMKVILGP